MAAILPGRAQLPRLLLRRQRLHPSTHSCSIPPRSSGQGCRTFSSSRSFFQQQYHRKESYSSRLSAALGRTRIQWYSIPVTLGIGYLGVRQFFRVTEREKDQRAAELEEAQNNGEVDTRRPKKRERIRPSGPWQVQIMSTLPLKALSRLWGRFNEIELPYYLRVPGFKLYSYVFGVNLDEVEEPDLHTYPNLAAFFYRRLKPGVRPLDPNPNALLSPSDGRVIQFGIIERGEVEQVKGVTYSLDALLGTTAPSSGDSGSSTTSNVHPGSNVASSPHAPQPSNNRTRTGDAEAIHPDEEFARVNGISYTLPHLFSGSSTPDTSSSSESDNAPPSTSLPVTDQSTTPRASSESAVRADLALGPPTHTHTNPTSWWSPSSTHQSPTTLYYIVVYLAPGDYHRFHSPVSWVVTSRRHFAGELYSVSPYLQRTLPGLFTLNERVVLLGRWRYGFFSYTPVGATNVGSIIVNFDKELRTNSLTTDTAADRAAEEAKERGEVYSGFAEATYKGASRVLGGHALRRGEEMGGFQLGSTIVLVFEAPKGEGNGDGHENGNENAGGKDVGVRKGGFVWGVEKGQKVRMGQALGRVLEEDEVNEVNE